MPEPSVSDVTYLTLNEISMPEPSVSVMLLT